MRHPIVSVTHDGDHWLAYVAQRRVSGFGKSTSRAAAVLEAWTSATGRAAWLSRTPNA